MIFRDKSDSYMYELTRKGDVTDEEFNKMSSDQINKLVNDAENNPVESGEYNVKCLGRTPEFQLKRGLGLGVLIVLAVQGLLSILSKLFK